MACSFAHPSLPSTYLQQDSSKVTNLSRYLSYTCLSSSHRAFSLAIITNIEPKTYIQAAQDPKWQEAMINEITALESNQTWILKNLHPGKKPISCKWVYRVKYKANGSIKLHKARLVAKSFTQRGGVDYAESFSR